MIVALNEAQQGEQCGSGSQCFKKIRVSVKSDPSKVSLSASSILVLTATAATASWISPSSLQETVQDI
ncbi:hypothetical protein BGZ47_009437 [Haplosporangium gracile]|nr:hypothetical protein BGZ47_009437 [Haplosporangium gracile]